MDASHIVVGGLTAITVALLVWIEIRSRHNHAAQPEEQSPLMEVAEAPPPRQRGRTRR